MTTTDTHAPLMIAVDPATHEVFTKLQDTFGVGSDALVRRLLGIEQGAAIAAGSLDADGRRSASRIALDLAKAVGTMSRLHDQLESALISFADYVTDSDSTAAELRDEINALANRIESWGRVIQSRTEHLA